MVPHLGSPGSDRAAHPLSPTTFKPSPDKWMAQDGVTVVLEVGEADIVLLTCADGEWVITRHQRTGEPAGGRGHIAYFGQSFAPSGVQVARFDERTPADEWAAVYRQLLGV